MAAKKFQTRTTVDTYRETEMTGKDLIDILAGAGIEFPKDCKVELSLGGARKGLIVTENLSVSIRVASRSGDEPRNEREEPTAAWSEPTH